MPLHTNNQLNLSPPTSGPDRTTTRRQVVLAAGAALGFGATGLGAARRSALADATPDAAATVCTLTPELTEGPYYVEDMLVRQDITEGKPGVPLKLRIGVMDASGCNPLANAAVDIWHCDADGYYSGISGENPGGGMPATDDANLDTTFLRGIQIADDAGMVEFDTIYPGWYTGRTIHIHMKVHVDSEVEKTLVGGHVAHTGQLFFDDAVSDEVFQTEAYVDHPNDQRLRNDQDGILGDHDEEPGFMLTLTRLSENDITAGFLGEVSIAVNPDAAPGDAGMPGGPGGQGGPPPGGGPGGPPPDGAPGGLPSQGAPSTPPV